MAKKKPMPQGKTWRFGGETLIPEALSETEERIFTETLSDCEALRSEEPSLRVNASVMRGRETAARACFGYFCERFGEEYGKEAVTRALVTAVAAPIKIVPSDWDPNSVPLGAALWMLDYAERQNLQSELLASLPDTLESGAEESFPPVMEFRYPPDLIPRLMSVLTNRKNVSIREFRKIMGLIRKDDAEKLRTAFRDAVLDYFGRYLEICRRVAPASAAPVTGTAPTLAPLPEVKNFFSAGLSMPAPMPIAVPTPPTPPARDASSRAIDATFLLKTPDLIGFSPEKMQSELRNRRMADSLSEFRVGNPYEICAASLLLERENDLLMNLNALTTAVTVCAERRLPWSFRPDGIPRRVSGDASPDTELRYPFQASDGDGDRRILSEGQLFYLATGYLPPRDRSASDALMKWFRGQGLKRERAREWAFTASAMSFAEDARADAVSGVWESGAKSAGRAAGDSRDADTADDAERIADLTRQLKSAKQSAHDKEQAIRQLEEQIREENGRAERDRMELRGLRETLYRTRAAETPEFAAVENQIQLPWQVRRRILIFGGHDTWSKSIRPLLPGARFFQRESLPDLNAIKGADVVWIQANALSHKFYYRIIDAARKENILVRYFSFASARKCAEQVVEYELSEGAES